MKIFKTVLTVIIGLGVLAGGIGITHHLILKRGQTSC